MRTLLNVISGKTSACVMAVLDMLPPEVKPNVLMILVLCHSNLAATHIQQEFCMLSKHMTGKIGISYLYFQNVAVKVIYNMPSHIYI